MSDGSLFRRTSIAGKMTADSMLQKYGSVYKREGAYDECIAGVSQNMLVFVLPHSHL